MPNEITTLRTDETLVEVSGATSRLTCIKAVESDSDARAADAELKSAKTVIKVIHDKRMSITRRVDQFKKSIMAEEQGIVQNLTAEVDRVSALTAAYLQAKLDAEREAARAEAERIAQEQMAAENAAAAEAALTGADVVAPSVVIPTAAAPSKPVQGVSSRRVWTFIVTDADAVPRQWCKPDEQLIRAKMDEVKRNGGTVEDLKIDGVKFAEEIRV